MSSPTSSLASHPSDSPRFIVAVAGIIVKSEPEGPKVLAMRRSTHKDAGAGLWESMSGRVQHFEEPLDAMKRELLEETGLSCPDHVRLEPRPITSYHALRLDEPMILVLYRGQYVHGNIRLSPEHDCWAWLSPDDFAARCTLTKLVNTVHEAVTPFTNPTGM